MCIFWYYLSSSIIIVIIISPRNINTENNTQNSFICMQGHSRNKMNRAEHAMGKFGLVSSFLVRKHKTMLSRRRWTIQPIVFETNDPEVSAGIKKVNTAYWLWESDTWFLRRNRDDFLIDSTAIWNQWGLILDIVWCEDSLGTRNIKYLTRFFPSSKSRHEEDG